MACKHNSFSGKSCQLLNPDQIVIVLIVNEIFSIFSAEYLGSIMPNLFRPNFYHFSTHSSSAFSCSWLKPNWPRNGNDKHADQQQERLESIWWSNSLRTFWTPAATGNVSTKEWLLSKKFICLPWHKINRSIVNHCEVF